GRPYPSGTPGSARQASITPDLRSTSQIPQHNDLRATLPHMLNWPLAPTSKERKNLDATGVDSHSRERAFGLATHSAKLRLESAIHSIPNTSGWSRRTRSLWNLRRTASLQLTQDYRSGQRYRHFVF